MRRFLLTMATAVMSLTAFSVTPEGLITSTPEGTLYPEVYTSCREFIIYTGMPARTTNTGYNTQLVINGDEIYIHNIIRDYDGLDSWIKGTITPDGVAEFKLPQPVAYTPGAAADGSDDTVLYAEMFLAKRQGNIKEVTPDTENTTLRMNWDGVSLTQILPGSSVDDLDYDGLCALSNSSHQYMGYGSQNIGMKIWDRTPLEAPADLEVSEYTLTYKTKFDSTLGGRVKMGTEGSSLWIQGLNKHIPEAWVKGEIAADGTVTIPSDQYMGLTNDYFMFFLGADYNRGNYTITDAVTLVKDGDNYNAQSAMLINLGNETVNGGEGMDMREAVFAPFIEVPLTPADPLIFELAYEEGLSMLVFQILPIDNDGVFLDYERLYFNVYLNDEPYTFTPEKEFVTETIKDIPYTYSNEDSYLMSGGEGLFIAAIETQAQSMGVRSFYRNGADGSNITQSELMFETLTGISETVEDSPIVDTRHYNLNGVEVSAPTPGLYIRRITRANGSIETSKVIIR